MTTRGLRSAQHLARRQWKSCAGVVTLHHLDVVLGAQAQEALEPRAGVLGTLALEAVRQQHHEARSGGATCLPS
jgi:hypothetical protein